jgi:CRISPR-associated endonuclease/helicase Cas3
MVADAIWQRLPCAVKGCLPKGAITLAAAHDLGKISPGFLLKAPLWPHADSVRRSVPAELETDHAKSSYDHLCGLASYAKGDKFARWLLSTAGHHGSYPFAQPEPRMQNDGGLGWPARLRSELLGKLIEIFGPLPEEPLGARGQDPFRDPWFRLHLLTGFTIFADWIGSNTDWFPLEPNVLRDRDRIQVRAEQALDELAFGPRAIHSGNSFTSLFAPDQKTGDYRPIQRALIDSADGPGLYILEAPMGSGKTEAALATAHRRWLEGDERGLFFALPTQLTSNKIHERVGEFVERVLPEPGIRALIHGNAWLRPDQVLEVRPTVGADPDEEGAAAALRWFASTRKALLAPFGTGTVDQALLAVIPARFAALRYFALAGKVVVIDEVHSYDPYTSALVDRLVAWLLQAGGTVIVLSATLTAKRRASLVAAAGAVEENPSVAYPLLTKVAAGSASAVSFPILEEEPDQKTVSICRRSPGEPGIWQEVADLVRQGGNVVVIRNTVDVARITYCQIKEALRGPMLEEHLGLLHSRFPQWQRDEQESRWMTLLGRSGESRPQGSLLVATQVVEQSVDIDADLLVTDLAPTDLILQRLGRLHRHRRDRPVGFDKPACWILVPNVDWGEDRKSVEARLGPSARVYPPFALWQAWGWWQRKTISLPGEIRDALEECAAVGARDEVLSPAVAGFRQSYDDAASCQGNTAQERDPFRACGVEDEEGHQTRWVMRPTVLLVLLAVRPAGSEVRPMHPPGTVHEIVDGVFSFPLAVALHGNAVRIPRYWLGNVIPSQPAWVSLHVREAVWAAVVPGQTLLDLGVDTELLPYRLHYHRQWGVWKEPNPGFRRADVEPCGAEDDFWY